VPGGSRQEVHRAKLVVSGACALALTGAAVAVAVAGTARENASGGTLVYA
jgi:hypothetical protein